MRSMSAVAAWWQWMTWISGACRIAADPLIPATTANARTLK